MGKKIVIAGLLLASLTATGHAQDEGEGATGSYARELIKTRPELQALQQELKELYRQLLPPDPDDPQGPVDESDAAERSALETKAKAKEAEIEKKQKRVDLVQKLYKKTLAEGTDGYATADQQDKIKERKKENEDLTEELDKILNPPTETDLFGAEIFAPTPYQISPDLDQGDIDLESGGDEPVAVPELSASGALSSGLLLGGLLMVFGARRRESPPVRLRRR